MRDACTIRREVYCQPSPPALLTVVSKLVSVHMVNFCQRNELLHGLFYFWLSHATITNGAVSFPFLRTLHIGLFILAKYSCQHFARVRDSNFLASEHF